MLQWLDGQKDALQAALNGEPLKSSLGILTRTAIERVGQSARAAFYLATPDGKELSHVVGMSQAGIGEIDAFKIGPDSPACGLAVHANQPVIANDVLKEPRWQPWIWLANELNIRACWSFPVQTSSGHVVGSFAIYLPVPCEPDQQTLLMADVLAKTAAIIIAHHNEPEQRKRLEQLQLDRVENALHQSKERYRTLFNSIDDGFCIIEVLFDGPRAVDYRLLETNPAFEDQIGVKNVIGRTAKELVPDQDEHWFTIYGEIATTGIARRFELPAKEIEKFYDVYAFRIGEPSLRQLAVLFKNISVRKRIERNVALLDTISVDLSTLTDPDEIMHSVGRRIAEFLNLSSCIFVDVHESEGTVSIHHGWMANDVPSLKQTFNLKDYYLTDEFFRASHANETFIIRDSANDPRVSSTNYAKLKIGSCVTIPFHWHGRWSAYIAATAVEPRDWRSDEIELLTEVSERVFSRLERARAETALKKSEENYRSLFETMNEGFAECQLIRNSAGQVIDIFYRNLNRGFEIQTGMPPEKLLGRRLTEIFPPADVARWLPIYAAVADSGKSMTFQEYVELLDRWYEISAYARGQDILAVFYRDITTRKKESDKLEELNRTLEDRVAERTKIAQDRAIALRKFAADLSTTEHRERKRMAQILHDDLQQYLVGIRFMLSGLSSRPAEEITTQLQRVDQRLQECLEVSRNLTKELSPPILLQSSLTESMKWLVNHFQELDGFIVHALIDDEIPSVAEHIHLFTFYAAKELMYNALKHSTHKEVDVELDHDGHWLTLTVQDGGTQFDVQEIERNMLQPKTFGLFQIRERAEALGGCLRLENSASRGARIVLRLPIDQNGES